MDNNLHDVTQVKLESSQLHAPASCSAVQQQPAVGSSVLPESTVPRSTPPAFRVTATLVPVGQAGKAKSSAQFEPASMNRMLCCVCKTLSVMSGDVLHVCVQAQLEEVLFSIIREKGFDEAHIDCYRMVTQFYQSRQPLCIIICGAAWTGGCWA